MNRIDIVKQRLAEISKLREVTAGELAQVLGLSRANVSSDLNRLCKEGTAEKRGTKPVYYRITGTVRYRAESDLNAFVQNNPSLFHCVEQAKASVLYPPHGMHMLLLGETGVGKSMLAELISRYAHDKGCLSENAPFIAFNCADYANNPQLLVSQLMGAKKGAYTGADSDRPGLLEKADGGILFLDEVHRLPPEGQEMLFTFMDKGTYRRLGETDRERTAAVLLICATTENPGSTLLKTFVRRIPMIIRIPSLGERSVDERLNLISTSFRRESARLGKPIFVSVNSVRSLLSYRCPNNVGQLKNDIMILCAKAYSDYLSGKKRDLRIVSADLPDYIREGLYIETTHRQIWKCFVGVNQRFCVFDTNVKSLPQDQEQDADNIYELIDAHMRELKEAGASDEQIGKEIDQDISLYFEKYVHASHSLSSLSNVESLVGSDIIRVTDRILLLAEKRLKRGFGDNIRCGVAVHIFYSMKRIGMGRKIINPRLNVIRKENPAEFSVALRALEIIAEELGLSLPIDEAGFLALFFSPKNCPGGGSTEKVQVVVIAHGASTATSMADAANRLLGISYAVGIDAPLDESPQKVYLRLKAHLQEHPAQGGLLLLVDMGSLTNFSRDLQNELKIPVKEITMVSTLHVIEAVRKAMLGYPLNYVYSETLNVNELLNESIFPVPDRPSKMFVITACTTGEGSAALMKNVLDSRLNYYESACETVAVRLTDKTDIRQRLDALGQIGKVLCVVSSFDVDLPVPHFGLSDVLQGSAVPEIQKLIDRENTFISIGRTLAGMLKNISNSEVAGDIRGTIEKIQMKAERRLTFDELVGVFFHMGCMVDRLVGKQPIAGFPEKKAYIAAHPRLFRNVKQSCRDLERKFGISLPEDEICYIASFFTHRDEETPA